MLLFYVGQNCYAIDSQFIKHILPQANLQPIPNAVNYLTGLLCLREKFIPIVDFSELIEKRRASPAFHTRIIVLGLKDSGRLVGLIGEKVIEIRELTQSQFVEPTVQLKSVPFLDGFYSDDQGVIQHLNMEKFFAFLEVELTKFQR